MNIIKGINLLTNCCISVSLAQGERWRNSGCRFARVTTNFVGFNRFWVTFFQILPDNKKVGR
jgi:hypothetical protein